MDELQHQFETFKKEVFRLELRDVYKVEGEWEEFQSYLRGQFLLDLESFKPWLDNIAQTIAAGKVWRRVHVVPSVLTPYLMYEIEWGYLYSAKAGERIGILEQRVYEGVRPRDFEPLDYWLFDNQTVLEMLYEDNGTYRGTRKVEDENLVRRYRELKDTVLSVVEPFEDFLGRLRRQGISVPGRHGHATQR